MKKEDIIELLGITVGIVVLTRIFYPYIQNLFSITDGYSAATLTSSLLMAVVTAIYVRYTYRIFDVTNKNTEQTANAQKIAYLERRLELFYLPMEGILLKNHPGILESTIELALHKMKDKKELLYFTENIDDEFSKDYETLRQFSYLACPGSSHLFYDFFYVVRDVLEDITASVRVFQFGSPFTLVNEKNIAEHRRVHEAIGKDIAALGKELAELVNL